MHTNRYNVQFNAKDKAIHLLTPPLSILTAILGGTGLAGT